MLFQRLYNWIKYKTLPSSILFKNRLFLERDSKNKRIFNNFGLNFRNSKWTNYENFNIKIKFKNLYIKYIFLIFFLIFFSLLLLYFNHYYISFFFFNNISYLFWICLDATDYFFSFIIWFMTIFSSLMINIIYSFFFFNNFSTKNKNKFLFFNNFFEKSKINSNEKINLILNKHDLNWFILLWLKKNNLQLNNKIFINLFDNKISLKWWNEYYNFFINLYKISYLCELSNNKNSSYNLNYIFTNILLNENKNFIENFYFFNKNTINIYYNFLFSYVFQKSNNYFNNKNEEIQSLFFLKKKFTWNPTLSLLESTKNSFLINNVDGFFFFNNFNFNKLNNLLINYSELINLFNNFTNQLDLAKTDRWLYRYSILHRKIFKNSHKLTNVKKLLNSGFYNTALFDKNIWASTVLNKNLNNDFINSLYNSYYNIDNNINNQLSISNQFLTLNSTNFKLLSFYENSFFFIIKRFFFFNNLSNNNYNNNYFYFKKNHILNNEFSNNTFYKFNLILNYLLNLKNKKQFDIFSIQNAIISNFTNFKPDMNFFKINDYLISTTELNIFNKNNLKLLYLLTFNNNNQNLLYFNYFNNPINLFLKQNSFCTTVLSKKQINTINLLISNFNNNSSTADINFWTKI